jgi:hypothetical protein
MALGPGDVDARCSCIHARSAPVRAFRSPVRAVMIALALEDSREAIAARAHPSAPASSCNRPVQLRPRPKCSRSCPPIFHPHSYDCICAQGLARGCSCMRPGRYLSPRLFDRCTVSHPCTWACSRICSCLPCTSWV